MSLQAPEDERTQETRFDSMVEVLRTRAQRHPDREACVFLEDGETETGRLTYGELDRRARVLAACLQERGFEGRRALLLYPPGLEFVVSFFGCLYAGAVAVPCYPPRPNRAQPRLAGIVESARPDLVLTTEPLLARIGAVTEHVPGLSRAEWLATDVPLAAVPEDWRGPGPAAGSLAFLQYTSGSTSLPKGVMVTHGNLVHNEEMIRSAFGLEEGMAVVGWLPLYHDMGLIGNVLQPLYVGGCSVLMPPLAFLQRPRRWLEAISRYRAFTSGGPDFAYALCARKIAPEQREGLDLSGWRVAFSGAEPVRADTLERFVAAFAGHGFAPEAFYPCYGLAEATLFVAGGERGTRPAVRRFRRGALERGRVEPAGDGGAASLVGCGRAWLGQRMVLADPETGRLCPEGQVGEIWVAGSSVADGYWGLPEESRRTFHAVLEGGEGPFLRTGDLGFVADGELFVAGRLKDLVILRGRNHYPQDLELAAERSHPALRPGGGAAFSVEVEGEERLVIAQELEPRAKADPAEVIAAIRQRIAEEHEVHVHEVVLLRANGIPKTSSGKIQRYACRAAYLSGELEVVARSAGAGEPAGQAERETVPAPGPEELLALDLPARRERLEAYLAGLFAGIARVAPESVDPSLPLTALGLDSLRAVELRNRIEDGLGVRLPLASVLAGPRLPELAAEVAAGLAEGAVSERDEPAAEGEAHGDFPLSPGQRGLWFLDRLASGGAYHIAAAARVLGPLDASALRRTLEALVERHPALRTTFPVEDGAPRQRVLAAGTLDFAVLDPDGSAGGVEELLEVEAYRPFDLESGPLLRVRVLPDPAGPVLLWTIHHIVADFASMETIARELALLYEGEAGGPPAVLQPLALRFTDHARWQERNLAGPAGERLRAYWERRLPADPAALDLPTDRPRPALQTYGGGSRALRFPSDGIEALARRHGTPLAPVLLAAWAALLHRCCRQDDLLVGVPTAGRGARGAEGVVGYFVNPLAFRADLSDDPPFSTLLERVRTDLLEDLEHQEYPFALLVERLRRRVPSRPPLFQTQLVLQQARSGGEGLAAFALGEEGADVRLGRLLLRSLALRQRPAQLDMTLMAARTEHGLDLSLQYNSGLFDGATAERLLGHFRSLIEVAAAAPETRLADLRLLGEAEAHQLRVEWNDTAAAAPEEALIHRLFEAQARRTPDALAVTGAGTGLTYRELDLRAGALAAALRALGVEPEVPVGICCERSPMMVVAMLGVLKAGGAYLPLDPTYPRERLALLVEDAGAPLVLTHGPVGELPGMQARRIALDGPDGAYLLAAAGGADRPGVEPGPDSLAYLIYTSGSTGVPKGVSLTHGGAVNLLLWARETFTPEELSGVVASTSIGFDLSVFEIFAPLSVGGTVVLTPGPLDLRRADLGRARLLNTVPSVAAELLEDGLPPGLLTVCLAGEPLGGELVRRLAAQGVQRIFNLYGPSETTTYSTGARLDPEGALSPSIGRPVASTRLYLVDERLRPVPIGVPGELCLGGAGLARGYLGRPGLTAERFVPDPLSGEPGSRLYRTGDLARFRPGGEVEFLGRLDHQVKVRGVRIEPGEIEARLLRHPEVHAAAVVATEGARRLVAYVVAAGSSPPPLERLRAFLREALPEVMVPAAYVFLDALPLTPNGKLDRRALPAPPVPATGSRQTAPRTPRTPVQELLAGLWSELLGTGEAGADDDFFELGGHSLLATRLVSRLRRTFGVDMPVVDVFANPTLGALARRIEEAAGRPGPAAPSLVSGARDEEAPLSYAQRRLWFLHRLDPASPAYHMPALVRLEGPLQPLALAAALRKVAARHEALRTVFSVHKGEPVQQVEPPAPSFSLPRIDLASASPELREAEALRLAHEEIRRPFDLARGPLLRAVLLRLSEGEHLLAITLHHIAADGWSLGLLVDEVAALYRETVTGATAALPALPVQYRDYALWQRQWLHGGVLDAQLAYWRRRLAGLPPPLDLPADHPRPSTRSGRGGRRAREMPEPLGASLAAVARRSDATLYMALLAGFAALLERYAGQSDLSLGSPVAGRGRVELEGLIGCFVNTLVLRLDLAGAADFRDLLGRTREAALGAYAHQDVPFECLVEELQPERDLGRTPLFQVAFVLQDAPLPPLDLPDLRAAAIDLDSGTAKFDLTLEVAPAGERLPASVEFSSDLFDGVTAERLLGHLETLLAAAAEDPARPLADLPLLSMAEFQALLAEPARAASGGPPPRCLHHLFAERAAAAPESPALSFEGEEMSYGELDRRANRLAHRLRALGVGAESRVAICLERSPTLVVALLGVLKAGGAYVPLDPSYPRERLAYVLADSGAALLLAESRLLPALPPLAVPVLTLDGEDPAGSAGPEDAPVDETAPENLAYVIYTSGSTGEPKGVAVSHACVSRLLTATDSWFGFDAGDVWTLFHSFAFDFSVWEIWGALAYGGRLVVVPYWVSRSPGVFRDLLDREGVTVLNQTPSAFRQLQAADEAASIGPALRLVIFGGEALEPRSLQSWFARHGDGHPRLCNMYGITETTVHVTCRPLTATDTATSRSPIGEPIPDLRVRLLGRGRQPVPLGVPGEIHVGGPGLARGYLGRPGLTAERFVPDPWSREPGGRLYRSGDLARRLPDGELDFLGRADQQVKVRGVRIEIGEVEAVLGEHPAVRESAVVPRREASGETRLVAYLVPRRQPPPGAGELRRFLALRLPEPMLPAAFVFLDALPLTVHGKLDRRALPDPAPARPELEAGLVAPRTPEEELLAGIWCDLLGLPEVGVHDSFFELGGHSLLATRVASRVREVFGVELPLPRLFETPTIAELARDLEGAGRQTGPAVPAPVRRGGDLPLSFAQERIWFLESFAPGTSTYNLSAALRLGGPLDGAALEGALDAVVARHEPLRTTFATVDGRPVQRIASSSRFVLPVIDLSGLTPAARDRETGLQVRRDAEAGFQLESRPPLRTALLRLAGEEHVLLVTLHHIAGDGWSMGVLVRDVAALYGAAVQSEPSPLPPLAVQFADYAAREREALAGEALAGEISFWRERLAGAPPALELPTDRPRPAVQTFRGARESLMLPPELAERLRTLSRSAGTTLFMTLLAAFDLLFARLAGQEEVVVGTPVAGRRRAELEELIGMFLNTLALRVDLSGNPTFAGLLARVREVALGAYAHQELPFERLLSELQPERSLARTPLFQVFFNLLSFPFPEPALPGLAVELLAAPEMPSKFDLTVYAAERRGGLSFDLVYNALLFDRGRMRELLGQYRAVLELAAAAPEEPIGTFSLVTPAAAALLPVPTAELDAGWLGTVHERFAAWARSAPERTAVTGGGAEWSYGELDARANRLAHLLLSRGVGRGDLVAIYGHRSAPLVWAVLGALKAGAAFTVLEPSHPAARLVETLRAGRPAAWVAIAGAGAPPPEVTGHLGGTDLRCRLTLDAGTELPAGLSDAAPEVPVGPDDVACVPFTSGSTGAPKGVLGRHGPLSHFIPWQCEIFGLGPEDRFSLLSGLAHDPLQRDIFTPLQIGAAVVIPEDGGIERPGWLAAWMARERVTVAHLTPALGQLLADSAAGSEERVESLRHAFLVGDVLSRRDVARLRRLAPAVTCVNLYGSTETQRAVGYHVATAEEAAEGEGGREILPLGRGVRDVQLLILNRSGSLAGVGELGEICVRSPHLAGGYLGDAALTGAKFAVNPFTGREGDRLYRTGDLGRYLPDGEAVFVSRADLQVKIRGFRIELGEIEAVLGRHPAVREAVVAARENGPDGRRLAAYVVPVAEPGPDDAELRRFLTERLPAYMVPADFVTLRELPLTANCKVDRRALPAPERRERMDAQPPSTPVEEVVAAIWADALGRDRVGVGDDFFALGGHSLLAMRIVARLHSQLGVELPLRALFETPTTVAGLARMLDGMRGAAVPPPIRPRESATEPPLSFAQRRLWFLDRFEPGNPLYNLPVALRLRGRLRVPELARALSEIERRHEALRTHFALIDGEPIQVIRTADPFSLPLVDLAGLPAQVRDAEVQMLATAEARRPFDLEAGPVWRGLLVRTGEDEHTGLLTLHHVAGDGWSLGVLVREVAALYGAFAAGRPSPLSELAVQYADYALWQRERLAGGVEERDLAFWRERLRGAPPLDLPADRPRPAMRGTRGGVVPVTLPPELAAGLRVLSHRAGATLFMTLLVGLQALLARWSGQRDVSVGTPVAGRTSPESEGLIGFFVNTLVLRVSLAGDPGFRELLDRVREAAFAAYAHQEMPFEKLVEELEPGRDLSRTPLFQVMLALQNVPRGALSLPGLEIEPLRAGAGVAKFDLAVVLEEEDGEIRGRIEHSADLFDRTTVERLARQLETLLSASVAAPSLGLSELPLLGSVERHQLRVEWNDRGATSAASGAVLGALFAAQAARTPEAIAVEHDELRVTYGELAARASRWAGCLRRLGVGPELPVAVCLPRSPVAVVALLAVLEAGGVCLPLDPVYPEERRERMLRGAGARWLLTTAALRAELPGTRVIDVEELDRGAEGEPGAPLPLACPEALPANLAYVIFTSGSTGDPKGVGIEHGAAARHFATMIRTFGLGPGERVLQFASASFDVSLEQILPPLMAGATVVLRGDGLWTPADLLAEMERRRLTVANLPTAYWQQWVHELAGVAPVRVPAELRLVIAGGEAMTPEAARLWSALPSLAGVRLLNAYGPTEAVITASVEEVRPGAAMAGPAAPIGRPLAGRSGHVLDAEGNLQPPGVPGELCLGGVLARGYLGAPGRTAERFVPDPAGEPGVRLYRTGDLARRLPDGRIEVLGRVDRQVKVRGFRIEPGEVEAALTALPGVREAAVLSRERLGDRRLVAYVAPTAAARLDAAELRAALARRLPEPMIPASFVFLLELPLTASGKVDRRALEQIAPAVGDRAHLPEERPRTPVEEVLASIWSDLLGVEGVGLSQGFFELGGHSLLAVRALSRVRSVLGAELGLRELFEEPTLAGFAARVERAMGSADSPGVSPIERREPGRRAPLSFAQQRLWFLDRMEPGAALFNIATALRLTGALSVPRMAAALSGIQRRHEVLRTVFPEENGTPVQEVLPPAPFPLPVIDLSGIPAPERAAASLVAAEARRSFDLERGPVWRSLLLRLGGEEHLALLSLHHIAADGWSLGVLVRELSAAYAALSLEPQPAVQYADFALWQRGWMQGEVLERHLAFWRKHLAGAPPVLRLPARRSWAGAVHAGGRRSWRLDRTRTQALHALARRGGGTLFTVLLAAFQVLLHRLTGQEDLVIGTDSANRGRVETEGMIGFFVNQLALRGDLSGDLRFGELLERVRGTVLEAYMHQDLPFDRLVEELNPDRHLSHSPLFQVKINHHNIPRAPLDIPGLALTPLEIPREVAQLDLIFNTFETGEGIEGNLEHRRDLFDAEGADRFLSQYEEILAAVTSDPDLRLSEIGRILDRADAERERARELELAEARQRTFKAARRRFVGAS